MELLDSRRLTGPNLIWDQPGAVLDIQLRDSEREAVIAAWRANARRMLDAVGWPDEDTAVHHYVNGVSLAISAPIDALYTATEINDWAGHAMRCYLDGGSEPEFQVEVRRLKRLITEESNSTLLELKAAASDHDTLFLSDDDEVSLGMGCRSQTWPVGALPTVGGVEWNQFGQIPLGLVTGTNGKTTTVRLVAAMVRAAGLCVGTSSTEGLKIDDELIEEGDYSGPGGARSILRDQRVQCAVLETARGGLQRRGLGVTRADAALITNVAADHLGDFGVHDVDALADVKWVITRALNGRESRLILNANDPLLCARAPTSPCPIIWFGEGAQDLCTPEGQAITAEDGCIMYRSARETEPLIEISAVPITFGGAAPHNVENAQAAIGLATALGLPREAIIRGLMDIHPNDNLGRGNLFKVGGASILIDFAHNPHGMRALTTLARQLPAKRRLITIGQAGDRPDELIQELVEVAATLRPEKILVKRYDGYARGRDPGIVAALIKDEFIRLGFDKEMIQTCDNDLDATELALAWARPGDLCLLFVLANQAEVIHAIQARQSTQTADTTTS